MRSDDGGGWDTWTGKSGWVSAVGDGNGKTELYIWSFFMTVSKNERNTPLNPKREDRQNESK